MTKHPDLIQNDPLRQPTYDGERVKQVKMETCPICGIHYATAIVCADNTIVEVRTTCPGEHK